MGDRDTALAALLFEMKGEIRADIRECKTDLSEKIADVRSDVRDLDQRMTAFESSSGVGLTKKQKAALWAGLSALLLEGARHFMTGLSALFAAVKGVPKL